MSDDFAPRSAVKQVFSDRESRQRIAIIGECDPALPSHRATNAARIHAAEHLSLRMDPSWLPSTELTEDERLRGRLTSR